MCINLDVTDYEHVKIMSFIILNYTDHLEKTRYNNSARHNLYKLMHI